ncbi:phage tail protein [Hyphomicrobium sulfonivorans]|uniref:phage tail protein n=1 Tax=Hyphomicrobium sulfonivorans TaxID=121290 RepID=UPI0015714EE9|nr:phage tail protein [Hyphomicrobium sulfonivorans]MBI1649882.1 phage tail protein [Hyphomicrobium sulfonivorans]NSL71793.1 phage tail protein [Hyphomicrobium sulfonivorans]
MSDPTFGISITRVDNDPRPGIPSDMSIVGIVGTAPQANTDTFPINTPVFGYSDNTAMMSALGATGTIVDALQGINDQLGEYQVAAKVVIVRVEEGATVWETISNIVGSSIAKTGIWALTLAGPILGAIPRLILTPGYTSQQIRGLATLTLGVQGANMTEPPVVEFTGGGTDPLKVMPTAHAVMGEGPDAGKVVALVVDDPGANLSGVLTVSFTGGGEAENKLLPTATAAIEILANPVCAALPPVLEKLVAHAVVDGPATTQQAYTDWRETIQSHRIIPIETAVKVGVNAIVKPLSPRVVGIGVRRDHEFQGRPFHSWANQPVQGIVGPNRPIDFSLTDGATEGQMLLSQNAGILVRGEMGVESAIASGGFVFIGTDNCSEDPLWQFYHVTRGRDYIHLMFLRTLRYFLGRRNIDFNTVTDIIDTVKFALRDLEADGDILPGAKVYFTRDQNSPEQLRLGKFTFDFACEEPPVLRYIGIRSARNRASLEILLDDLLAQIDAAV